MDLEARIQTLSASLGADYFGIADLAPADVAIRAQGGEEIARYQRAVVIGITLLDDLIDLLPRRETRTAILYRHHAYDVVNTALDQITLRLAVTLQKEGHRALPVPASKRTDDERICGIFSHKLAAHLAGLGWIGKSCLLITPEHGPRVRWGSGAYRRPGRSDRIADGGTVRGVLRVREGLPRTGLHLPAVLCQRTPGNSFRRGGLRPALPGFGGTDWSPGLRALPLDLPAREENPFR